MRLVSSPQVGSATEGRTYPSPSYMQQSFPHYPLGNGSRNAISVMTSGSPHTSVSRGMSVINSPLTTPASASILGFVISPSASRISIKMDLDMTCVDPNLRGPGSGLGGSASIPIEPVWIDHQYISTKPIRGRPPPPPPPPPPWHPSVTTTTAQQQRAHDTSGSRAPGIFSLILFFFFFLFTVLMIHN